MSDDAHISNYVTTGDTINAMKTSIDSTPPMYSNSSGIVWSNVMRIVGRKVRYTPSQRETPMNHYNSSPDARAGAARSGRVREQHVRILRGGGERRHPAAAALRTAHRRPRCRVPLQLGLHPGGRGAPLCPQTHTPGAIDPHTQSHFTHSGCARCALVHLPPEN